MKRIWIASVLSTTLLLSPAAVSGAGAATSNLSADYAKAQAKANDAAKRFGDAETQLALAEDQIAALNDQVNRNKDLVATLTSRVRDMAVADYVGAGQSDSITDLTGDVNDDVRRRVVLAGVAEDSQETMDAFLSARDNLQRTQSQLESELSAQRAAVDELKKSQLEAEGQLDVLAKQLAALKAQQARAAAAPAPKKTTATTPAPQSGTVSSGSGAWLCPVAGANSFSDTFGAPRSGGRTHQGTDIMAARNTPIVAHVSGFVKAHESSLGGHSYYLQGVDGNEYYGAHLDHYGTLGNVTKGTVIGYVGTSGNGQGGSPHLHFEMHPGGGAAVNPYSTLKKYC